MSLLLVWVVFFLFYGVVVNDSSQCEQQDETESQCNSNNNNSICDSECSEESIETKSIVDKPKIEILKTTQLDLKDETGCLNLHKDCEFWSEIDECTKNPGYMLHYCAKACKTCHLQTEQWRNNVTNCVDNPEFTKNNECNEWAKIGECHKNPSFMRYNCVKSCNFCTYETRCNPFSPLISELHGKFQINNNKFHNKIFIDNILNNSFIINKYGAHMIYFDPPIIKFDRFIEYDSIINQFLNDIPHHYERSADAGPLDINFTYEQVVNDGRTSHNAWCNIDCQKYNSSKYILQAIEEILQLPQNHFEHLQVLQYDIGQKYNTHHDFIEAQWDMPCGPRILTFFIYLNDVENGGETEFPKIGVKVKPKKGTAILWPNVPADNVFSRLDATHHAALPVKEGLKHGVNAWIHLYDFMGNYDLGCTG